MANNIVFNPLNKLLQHKIYTNSIAVIILVYFVLYSAMINFELSQGYLNLIYFIDHYIIFSILLLEFIARIINDIFYNKMLAQYRDKNYLELFIITIKNKPWNLVDIALFAIILYGTQYNFELMWIRIIRVLYLVHDIPIVHIQLLKIMESKFFNYLNTSMIILFSILISIQNTYSFNSTELLYFQFLDVFIMMYFILEVSIKIFARKKISTFFMKDNKLHGWNTFDFLIVFISVLPLEGIAGIAVARVLRLLRVMRLLSAFKGLKKIIKALTYSVQSIGNIILLLFIIFFIYANIGVQFFGDFVYEASTPNLWADLPSALLTLYRVLTFEDWTDVMYQAQEQYPIFGAIYFVTFTAISVFIFLNLFTGVIIEQIQKANSSLLKFRLKDEQSDIEDGFGVYNFRDYTVIFNKNEKLPYILQELNNHAINTLHTMNVIVILDDNDKVECYEEGDCFVGSFEKLKIQFIYADVMNEETHHRFNIQNASSVIILSKESPNPDGKKASITADNYNIKIFTYLMNNKEFVLNMIDLFISRERIDCLVEVHSESSEKLIKSILEETIYDFIELTQNHKEGKVSYSNSLQIFNNRVLLLEKFKNTREKFIKRCEAEKRYLEQFPKRDFFSIVNQNKSAGKILSNGIEYYMIYKSMLEFFSFENGNIKFIKNSSKVYKNWKFIDAYLDFDDGLLLGYSKQNNQGYIESYLAPHKDEILKENYYLIVYSLKDKIKKGVQESYSNTIENLEISEISKDKKILLICDGTRDLEFEHSDYHIKNDSDVNRYYDKEKGVKHIKDIFLAYDYIIINQSDERGYNLILLFLETFKDKKRREEIKKQIIIVFDNRVSAKLLSESFYKFHNSIVSKQLLALFMTQIANDSHMQDVIRQLVFNKQFNDEESDVSFKRLKVSNIEFENFDQLKGELLKQGLLYIASVNEPNITINDDNYEDISEVIVIKNRKYFNLN